MKKFSNEYLSFTVNPDEKYENISIDGIIFNPSKYTSMVLIGANPPDRLGNYSGTSLPFPCFDIAFDNTVNKHTIDQTGSFNINFKYPNSYYKPDGYTKIVSPIIFVLDNMNITFELEDKCKLKTLANRSNNPLFYSTKEEVLPIDTAENVMYAYANAKFIYNIA